MRPEQIFQNAGAFIGFLFLAGVVIFHWKALGSRAARGGRGASLLLYGKRLCL